MKLSKAILSLIVVIGVPVSLAASSTQFWQTGTFEDFLGGNMVGVALSKEGSLRLAPEAQVVFNPGESLALSLAADQKHNLYIGTGHEGKIFRVDPKGEGSLFLQTPEPEILAVAVGPGGDVYAASSPEGKIYRVTPEGKSAVFFDPKSKYIWALAFDHEGNLYAGTGDRGLIFRIDRSGQGKVFFDSNQTHIMCLSFDAQGRLLAGSEPDGLVYRITSAGKAFVLYKANLPEIHALATDSQGRIYAAALGSAAGRGTPELFAPTPAAPVVQPTVTTVTVQASTEGAQGPPTPPTAPKAPKQSQPARSFNLTVPGNAAFQLSQMNQGRGALIRILPDYSTETLWRSDRESIFGLALRGNDVLFSTDGTGRIFDLSPTPDGPELTLVTETRQSLATRLLLEGNQLYVATSNIAKLFRVGAGSGAEGTYESAVKDAKFISRWGVLAWRAEMPAGAGLEFYSRSGNSERPDNTWSDWAGPYNHPEGSAITSPPARFIQWKVVFRSSGDGSPILDNVSVAYLNQNLPPEIHSLNVSTAGERTGPSDSSPSSSPFPASANVTVSAAANPFSGGSAPGEGAGKTPTVISWQADDPNGDQLAYTLYLRAADEQDWHRVKDRIKENNFTLDPSAFPDGQYEARVVASDAESNPPGLARQTELVSAPFWIDNTPPQIRLLDQKLEGAKAIVRFEARTATSPLRRAQASIDGKPWTELEADDGLVDSPLETFTVRTGVLEAGEHVVTVRASDTAGNSGVGKAVIPVPTSR